MDIHDIVQPPVLLFLLVVSVGGFFLLPVLSNELEEARIHHLRASGLPELENETQKNISIIEFIILLDIGFILLSGFVFYLFFFT